MRFIITMALALLSGSVFSTETISGLHTDWMDRHQDPMQNFFLYANGNWIKHNPVPPAYSNWGQFHALEEKNLQLIRTLLIRAAENKDATKGSIEQQIGDFYASGMDEKAIEAAGIKPLLPEFLRIDQIKNNADLERVVAHLHEAGVGALFDFQSMQDLKDSREVIAVLAQGGLSLPDRDYYLKNDTHFKKIRAQYLAHIRKLFELAGDSRPLSDREAKTVMRIETTLAKASMPRILMRNPRAVYHPMSLETLQTMTPDFSWRSYFSDMGLKTLDHVNLAMPAFFKIINAELKTVSLQDWKIYLRWHVLDSFAPYLSKPFEREDFKMKVALTGVKEELPRWKRVIGVENQALGFAIGKIYVEEMFSEASKKAVESMIQQIHFALKEQLQKTTWMSENTKQAALQKLNQMEARVGYPAMWWDYSSLEIHRDSYLLNVMRASRFLTRRDLNKIGKPVDKNDWDMTPQTINAYYDASMNRLNIPAGILQPPFFDINASAAINYGAIGFVIGHEMTHGFDDQGAQFDGTGNLKNWWTQGDLMKFQKKTQKIADQFSRYVVNGSLHVQGKLVMGEAAADLGGLRLAFRAFHTPAIYETVKTVEGFTPDQQFFLSAAHIWASNIRPEEAEHLVMVDPHPPAMYRVNGTLADMTAFREAFGKEAKNRQKPKNL
ncbi:MAG TPA: M13 family metallopeptidase [Gammaproteobacteria bacterium]|nr:M13 family metallopeptidase [Gammaproteobacteria bacterium]